MSTLDKVLRVQELYRTGVSRFTLPSLDRPLSDADPDGLALIDVLRSPDPSRRPRP